MCSPDIPDTTGAQMASIETQKQIADRQFALQKESLDYFKERQVGLDATTEEVVRRQMAMAEETNKQGTEMYNYQKDVFRPVEQSLVSQAMRESTPEYYEQYVQKAVASTASAQRNAQGQTERNLSSMGVNPNSGAWQSQQRGLTLGNAAALGGVANDSRDKAESLSWARQAEVAGLGKGLVGAGNASYGLAANANNSAVGAANSATNTAAGTMGTATQYGGLAVQGSNNVTQAHNDIYKTAANASGQQGGGLGGALGSLAGQFAGSASGSAMIAGLL